jgi:hypothetical protein
MKKVLFLIFILSVCLEGFSQRARKIIYEGQCYVIIDEYRKFFNNDSITIQEFKNSYVVETKNISSVELARLFAKNPSEIIAFFDTEAGKKIRCYIKGYRNRYDLLE